VIEETVSLREAHRCVKIWRAMWKITAALGYCERDADRSLGVGNRCAWPLGDLDRGQAICAKSYVLGLRKGR
jgi:hypothetical protein